MLLLKDKMIINPKSLNRNFYICNKFIADYLVHKKDQIILSIVDNKYYFSKSASKQVPAWMKVINF
jgi:hypothetical protein